MTSLASKTPFFSGAFSPPGPWAWAGAEKNQQLRLKAATNKDLKHLDTIPSLKFAAKIRGEGQNMNRYRQNFQYQAIKVRIFRPEAITMPSFLRGGPC